MAVCFAMCENDAAIAFTAPFFLAIGNNEANCLGNAIGYKYVSANGAQTATITSGPTAYLWGAIGTFKESEGGGGGGGGVSQFVQRVNRLSGGFDPKSGGFQ
jgi:hypothetical protein